MNSQQFSSHAQLFKVLAHPRRLAIIHLLRKQELNVSQMCEVLNLPQANLSQHLMLLRHAGIVSIQKKGKQILYKLVHTKINEIQNSIKKIAE